MFKFTLSEPANDDEFGVVRKSNYRWLVKGSKRLIRLKDIQLLGSHNVSNVLAAYALVDFLKLSDDKTQAAIKTFRGLAHRMQTVCVNNNITWINDSKATNVGATATALLSLEDDVFWIAGGQGKDANFHELASSIKSNIKLLILFGEDADLLEVALAGKLPIKRVADMAAAVKLAGQNATKGSVILLSPACASFDMYQNYEQRGEDFTTKAKKYVTSGVA